MFTFHILTDVRQIVMDHFVYHDIHELLFREIVIVCNENDGIIYRFVKPSAHCVLEIATRPEWVQQVKQGNRQFTIEKIYIALIERESYV